MELIRHVGIYVNDIRGLEVFYSSVFHMKAICSMQPDSSPLFDELLDIKNAEIMTTKLITPYGNKNGRGDMLELVKVISDIKGGDYYPQLRKIYLTGMWHIAFETDDIFQTADQIRQMDGRKETDIVEMKNGNFCCFCTDPEGNWIELIQRHDNIL